MSTSFGGASVLALIVIVCYIRKKRGKNMKTAAFGAALFVASSVGGKLIKTENLSYWRLSGCTDQEQHGSKKHLRHGGSFQYSTSNGSRRSP
jgi:hypothetical protein